MSKIYRNFALAALAVLALAAAGCGSNNDSQTATPAKTSSTKTSPSGAATISTGDTDVGTVLTGPNGMTVYMFKADKNGKSSCDGACAAAWPPVTTTGDPKVSGDADQSKLGTTKRDDGSMQVTYAGWPLYTYVQDTKAGDAKGNDVEAFGADWYALTAAGEEPKESGDESSSESSSSSGSDSSSGSGY